MLVPGAAGPLWDEADGRSAEARGVLHRSVGDPASQRRLFFFFFSFGYEVMVLCHEMALCGSPRLLRHCLKDAVALRSLWADAVSISSR